MRDMLGTSGGCTRGAYRACRRPLLLSPADLFRGSRVSPAPFLPVIEMGCRVKPGNDGGGMAQVAPTSPRRGRWRGSVRRKTAGRSEEHTSELQSLMSITYAFLCLKTQ